MFFSPHRLPLSFQRHLSPLLIAVPLLLSWQSSLAADKAAPRQNAHAHAAAAPESFMLLAAGDIANCKLKPASQSVAEQTARIIEAQIARNPSARVITLGDNTYPVGKPEEFAQCYDPTWGRFKDKTWPSPGNHDYAQPKAVGYYQYFEDLAGPERRGYYTKQLGNWQIISLNSNLNEEQMRQQLGWLKEQLADSRAGCRLAFWHHPAYSSGGHGNNAKMWPFWQMLADAGTDIVLSGHDHDYERFVPMNRSGERDDAHGIRNFIVGTGGAKLTPMFFPKSTTEVRDNATHGVLRLHLSDKAYEWTFLPVEDTGFSDQGKGSCHNAR